MQALIGLRTSVNGDEIDIARAQISDLTSFKPATEVHVHGRLIVV